MPSIFILGPYLDNVFEPIPPERPVELKGYRQVVFGKPATVPGGLVNCTLLEAKEGEVDPLSVYAFYFQPVKDVPPLETRTPDFFFKSGAPSGTMSIHNIPENGRFTIKVPNVQPSLEPYWVQIILEYPA